MSRVTDIDLEVSRIVRHLRRANDQTQEDVATLMRPQHPTWTRTTVSEVDRGKRPITMGESTSLCAALDTSLIGLYAALNRATRPTLRGR